jgi:hypothetical protein
VTGEAWVATGEGSRAVNLVRVVENQTSLSKRKLPFRKSRSHFPKPSLLLDKRTFFPKTKPDFPETKLGFGERNLPFGKGSLVFHERGLDCDEINLADDVLTFDFLNKG